MIVCSEKAVREEEVKLRGVGFVKQVGFNLEWKRKGVLDVQRDESEEDEVTGEYTVCTVSEIYYDILV